MPSILPDPATGAVVYRDIDGNPTMPPDVQNAYSPAPAFVAECELTAIPSDCTARIEPKQINAIVSELLALAECFAPEGPWNCNSVTNLCAAFTIWFENHAGVVDGISIVGAGTAADPYTVGTIDCGTY